MERPLSYTLDSPTFYLYGTLLILLLLLIIGPCVLNRQVTFIRTKISAVRLLVLRQQYHALKDQVCQGEDSV